MSELFLKIINMSISASWLVLVVLAFRFLFRKAPKWVNVLLWGIVAVRLICPFSIESALSLIPSAETIPLDIGMDTTPAINSGISAVNSVVNPIISQSNTPMDGASINPLQITIGIYESIWIFGVTALLVYTLISYWRLQRKVSEAVILRENIFQSENVGSPFVLGIIKPRIYLPYNMNKQDLEHVVAHERAHIRRKDHLWKPLGFLLLTIHWFNPLMWLAYVLLCRDIELACDEKVIQELGNEQRADYSQALVACSVNRRMIAACPLAFGEVGVKERVKSVLNYKKPAFWVIVVSVVACAVVAVCFLTNPRAEREFPINGKNVADLDTNLVLEKIIEAERLESVSQLCVNADNFDLMFTPDFNWANDGAIRFFYGKNEKTYSAQLRMFHEDNKYFITERSEWVDQDRIFNLGHYLDALKYMPQEEIRQLSPDADGYSVMHVDYGEPSDFERVLKYSKNGIEEENGWYIHLEVQPLHKVEGGAYNGRGDEVIHIFYGDFSESSEVSGKTYTYEKEGIMGDFTITLYNDGTFSYYEGMASSYLGFGSWTQNGDAITLTDDGHGGLGLINHFEFDKTDLIFVEEGSSNFIYVKVQNGERFYYTGEAVKPEDATLQPGNSETLSLDDVVALSKKGYDLTWSDFDQYRYIETGSGLYIRVYEINEMFELWIGGSWTDEDPMYIWLTLADDLNTRIDIRDGGVEEFITKDYSETLLNRAIYDAILDCNVSEKTVGLNNCASFIMLDKEEISGTPVAGSTDHVGLVTVYGLALYQGYDMVDGKLHEEAGSHTPVVITFDVLNGRYSLKEYWRPGDGTYYEPDIREKFPDRIEDEAMNTQKYIAAQKQECYVQAMRNNGEEVSDPDSKPLSAEELSWFNETFYPIVYDKQGNPISVNPVSGFFSSYYDDVRNMDFEEFMRYFPEDGSFASDAEFEALKIVEAWPFDWVETRDDMPVPIHKYQARIVDMVLKEYAGITTADLNTSDVAYLADYDAFYNYTSDFGPGMFTCTRGEVDGDIVRLYEEFETGTDMLTLRKVGDNYMIVAHQCIEGDNNAERVYGR